MDPDFRGLLGQSRHKVVAMAVEQRDELVDPLIS
ncbi:MAG: hypothetical protein Ct9H300mP12_10660 [Acidimicrobiales bacterium]|nr:MAG: hypothetical protein Ct9H300mP12_10660 [Acidimicrobiales bacterium]